MHIIRDLINNWYLLFSQMSAAASIPAKQLSDSAQLPLLSVFIFGFVGALSPCQITTHLSALAYVSCGGNQRRVWRGTLAYIVAKGLVYMSLGAAITFLGIKLTADATPVLVWVRKAIGPLLLVVGLSLLGLVQLRGNIAGAWLDAIRRRLPEGGIAGAFFLGLVFSFAFCPSLSWLFFGLMIPLAVVSSAGWLFPAVFAVGNALPLLVLGGVLAAGREMSAAVSERLMRLQAKVSRIAGAVFIIAGVHDTLVYWFL